MDTLSKAKTISNIQILEQIRRDGKFLAEKSQMFERMTTLFQKSRDNKLLEQLVELLMLSNSKEQTAAILTEKLSLTQEEKRTLKEILSNHKKQS